MVEVADFHEASPSLAKTGPCPLLAPSQPQLQLNFCSLLCTVVHHPSSFLKRRAMKGPLQSHPILHKLK
jgi:hypothetical protein